MEYVKKRHHFVHRNGKNHQDKKIATNKEEIVLLIQEIRQMCDHVDREMKKSNNIGI